MSRPTRPISWFTAARKDFEEFPEPARIEFLAALTIAAEGGKADTAKPLKGFGSGIIEIAVRHRGDAFRLVYAVQMGQDVWVFHAFQKKSKKGIETPHRELQLVRERIQRLKEYLRNG